MFELNLLSAVDVNKLKVGLEVRIALFVVLKSLGDLFFEFGDFGLHRISLKLKITYIALLNNLASVEHLWVCLNLIIIMYT